MFTKAIVLGVVLTFAASFPHDGHHHPIEHHAPQPYKFGYSIKDHHGEQHREESGDGGHSVKGSYGFTDARGVHRVVEYIADHGGFRAHVKTNEPGTASQNPAEVIMESSADPGLHGYAGHLGHGAGFVGDAGHGYYGGLGLVGPYAGAYHGGLPYGGGYGYGLSSGLLGGQQCPSPIQGV